MRREPSNDIGAMFCSSENASTLSTVASSACARAARGVQGQGRAGAPHELLPASELAASDEAGLCCRWKELR